MGCYSPPGAAEKRGSVTVESAVPDLPRGRRTATERPGGKVERPKGNEPSDEALVAAAQGGEARALERLLVRHEGRVFRVLRLLGVGVADREDVAQEVFVRIFRHLDGFRRGRPFTGWLFRVAVNAAHDHRRRVARRLRGEADWSEAPENAPASGPGPAETLAGRDHRRQLETALESLSERERAVFVLCELEGLTTREVARALGITMITVRRHLGRARRRLQGALTEKNRK